ncbi:MAG TPA: amidase family protein [Burkholderiales bacterium]|nr:amidase family protein [Burkholderiales bacterium]
MIARSVEDIALYRAVLLGVKPEPIASETRSAPRIGFCRTHIWEQCEPATRELLEACAKKLAAAAGATLEDVTLPEDFKRVEDAHRWISSFEFARNFTYEIENHWEKISATLRNGRLNDGLACSFEKYREARDLAERCRRMLADVFMNYDVLLTPAAAGEAPIGLNSTGNASFCAIWTTMLVPAMTLPLFTGPHRLPIGAQLIAPRNADRKLFEVARWVQRAYAY